MNTVDGVMVQHPNTHTSLIEVFDVVQRHGFVMDIPVMASVAARTS